MAEPTIKDLRVPRWSWLLAVGNIDAALDDAVKEYKRKRREQGVYLP